MKCTILHESRGRLRVHVCNVRMTLHRADVLEAYLNHHDAVSKAKVYERTGDVVVYYTGARKDAVAALSTYRFDDPDLDALVTSADSRRINQEYQEKSLTTFPASGKSAHAVQTSAASWWSSAPSWMKRPSLHCSAADRP